MNVVTKTCCVHSKCVRCISVHLDVAGRSPEVCPTQGGGEAGLLGRGGTRGWPLPAGPELEVVVHVEHI